jgi:hypothetical protein
MHTATQIIKALGDSTAVAKALGVTPSTVQSWKEANFIPDWRQATLLALAKKKNFALSKKDFPPVSARIPRRQPAALASAS